MEMNGNWLRIDETRIAQELGEASARLSGSEDEMVLGFSGVRRIDSAAVRALEELTVIAVEKGVKVGLSGVKVDVYKVLKLLKLASRFSFVNQPAPSSLPEAGEP